MNTNSVGNVAEGLLQRQKLTKLEEIQFLQKNKEGLSNEVSAINHLKTKLLAVKTSLKALGTDGNLLVPKAEIGLSGSTVLSASVSPSALKGTYSFEVLQVATPTFREGGEDIVARLSETNDVSSLLMNALPLQVPISTGFFTVNGVRIEIHSPDTVPTEPYAVSTTDFLEDLFLAISLATEGSVSANYDSLSDTIELSSDAVIQLGSPMDTSNVLTGLKLFGNGTSSVTSDSGLGALDLFSTLENAHFAQALSAGEHEFKINGVSFSYNTAVDSIFSLIDEVNQSQAGVSLSYDSGSKTFSLKNKVTGSLGLALEDTSGNLLATLGFNLADAPTLGNNARFKLNGQENVYQSTTNTVTESVHGVKGLTIVFKKAGSDTVTVEQDAAAFQAQVNDFIGKYNQAQSYLNEIASAGKAGVTLPGALHGEMELYYIKRDLRSYVSQTIPSLENEAVHKLAHLGFGFNEEALTIKDTALFDSTLQNQNDLFNKVFTAEDGFVQNIINRIDAAVETVIDPNQHHTIFDKLEKSRKEQITTIDKKIESAKQAINDLEKRMEAGVMRIDMQKALGEASLNMLKNGLPAINKK